MSNAVKPRYSPAGIAMACHRYFPLPDNATVCLPDLALSVMVNVAERAPLDEGLKFTLMLQLLPGLSELPQVVPAVLAVKSEVAPVIARPMERSGVVPVFLSVTVLVELVFTVSVPKLRLVALRLACGLITSALRATVCGLPGALSIMLKVAVCWV